jgi:hypothetical protein
MSLGLLFPHTRVSTLCTGRTAGYFVVINGIQEGSEIMKYQNGKGSASFVMFLNIASHSMGSMSGV